MMRSTTRAVRTMLWTGCCVVALSTPVLAQDAEEGEQEILVTGSRIPTIRVEGPTAVTVIDSKAIQANGYASVADLLAFTTQNSGQVQSPQSSSSSAFTPGAQQVDLRGLGANHTLVLINGRRIADFPLPMSNGSNFADISNIPLGLIERVEIMSGSASAIYGSDAIAGVVNFKMKDHLDGVTLDYRHGRTEHGGGMSHRVTLTGGFSTGRLNFAGGVELLDQKPLWAFDRARQDSTLDNPVTQIARRTFLRYDPDNDAYRDPTEARCSAVSYLNRGSTGYFSRPRYSEDGSGPGFYCGSQSSIAYSTIVSTRKGFNSFGTFSYELSDNAKLFTDFQFGISKVKLMYDVTSWAFETSSSSSDNTFYNAFDGRLDDWSRQFTPEEAGGFQMQRNKQTTFSITPGIRGEFGKSWGYEASFNYAQYKSVVSWPQIIKSRANALFLGPQLGVDADSGYPIFNADPDRLYTPLTTAEYDSISADTVYRPKSWTSNLQLVLNNTALLQLPAGPVGFAAVAEYGKQGYNLRPDPLALTDYYFSWLDSDGKGKRSHAAAGGELKVPVFSFLTLSGAGRYDYFRYGGQNVDKFTYNLGAELRPTRSVLLRASYGTGFRAPDLHYLFAGPGNDESGGTDYYRCGTEEPDVAIEDCSYADSDFVRNRSGNRQLKPETAKTLTAGLVFEPSRHLFVSVDYFNVRMSNQVANIDTDNLLRNEASCRMAMEASGVSIDQLSALCQDAISRVVRFDSGPLAGDISAIKINPINVSNEKTSGIDIAVRGNVDTGIGNFSLSVGHTHVFKHRYQEYPGDPYINKLAVDSSFYVPRDKSNASLTWENGPTQFTLSGTRLGKLPNYDEDAYVTPYYLFNANLQHDFTDHFRGSLTVRNLLDANPVKDDTWSAYPYYNESWYDTVGRSVFLQLTYKLGGAKL